LNFEKLSWKKWRGNLHTKFPNLSYLLWGQEGED
jgi:hypothetical protein